VTNIQGTQSIGSTLPSPEARLRDAVTQLEGVFVEQLFKAMRATVPDDGLTNGGAGEEMFTSLMDQHLASSVPERWDRGLTDALTRQLQGRLGPDAATAHAGDASRTAATANAAAPLVDPTIPRIPR
jgi:peptidoglycan hydrolase FlgJ